jgi:hypothetical protein
LKLAHSPLASTLIAEAGNRGDQKHIDFVIKFLEPGSRKETRTPAHIHWVVDLLLKAETHRDTVAAFVKFYRAFYESVDAFESVDERNSYQPVTPARVRRRFGELSHHGTYSLEYLSYLLELFAICEKASPRPIKMFPELLSTLQRYFAGERDFVQVLGAAVPRSR